MKRIPRIVYTDSQKALMWDRWQKGETMHDIASLFDRHHPSIRRILTENGGIQPRQRKRSSLALTLAEREVISFLIINRPLTRIDRSPQLGDSRP